MGPAVESALMATTEILGEGIYEADLCTGTLSRASSAYGTANHESFVERDRRGSRESVPLLATHSSLYELGDGG